MFIRKRRHNKRLSVIMLIVFLAASAFTETAGSLPYLIANSMGCNLNKEKPSKAVALQLPCTGTEKEEKKAEQMAVEMSQHPGNMYSKLRDRCSGIRYTEFYSPKRAISLIFLINKTLRR